MAKTTGPLFSLGASGKLADTLVYAVWKGIATVRQFVVPANPNTTAQQNQRGFFTNAVAFWRNTTFSAASKTAWNRGAGLLANPQSGFNAFSGQAIRAQAEDPDASFVTQLVSPGVAGVTFDLNNIDDVATGDESGSFTLSVGTSADALTSTFTASIAAGQLVYDISGSFALGDAVFMRVAKNAGTVPINRSGIYSTTLT